jgi:hypothetical protein
VRAHCFAGLGVLFGLIFVSGAYAGGTYQRTDDHKKALVWNNDPKPGDIATWSGDRDANGYATGPGTLQWFRVGPGVLNRKRTPISSYSGTMLHGKFNGGVMTVDHGKAYHATFADGQKKGQWIAGPLITKAKSAESVTSTEAASEAPSTEKVSKEKTQTRVAKETMADVPAERPASAQDELRRGEPANVPTSSSKATNEESSSERTEKVSQPLIAQTSAEEPDQSPTPREPVTRKSALAPGPVRAIERPTRTVTIKPEAEPARQSERAKPEKTKKPSKIAKPASSQSPEADTQVREDIPAEGHVSAQDELRRGGADKKETPVDDSLHTLTGPPSSLHINAPPKTNPPTQISTPSTTGVSPSPPPPGAKLTAVQAMDIADIEARTKGHDLGEYQLPKAEYNAANGTWLVAYAARDADKDAKKLTVTIQDKTGKAEVGK